MNWTDDFSFLLKPTQAIPPKDGTADDLMGNLLDIHTENHFPDLENVELVLLGIKESRRSEKSGVAHAPDIIREKLYSLFFHGEKINIADVGNIEEGNTSHDTDSAVKTVVKSLLEKNIAVVILGEVKN